jgi:hypothetical protein
MDLLVRLGTQELRLNAQSKVWTSFCVSICFSFLTISEFLAVFMAMNDAGRFDAKLLHTPSSHAAVFYRFPCCSGVLMR